MDTILFNAKTDDNERRELLYQGQLAVYSATCAGRWSFASSLASCAGRVRSARPGGCAPLHSSRAICRGISGGAQAEFIHHPRLKELIQGLLTDLGCDLEKTYFDVPRLRTMRPTTT